MNWSSCIPPQLSLFQTQQPCLSPCLCHVQVLINDCPLGSHRAHSVQYHSYTVWEHEAKELGCFCLNLSWISFSNLSKLLICEVATYMLPTNLLPVLLPNYFFLLLHASPSMHRSDSSSSFTASNGFLVFAFQPTICSPCCSDNQLPPSLCQR